MTAKCDVGSWVRKKDISGMVSLGSADEGWQVIFGAILYFVYKPALFQSEKFKNLNISLKKECQFADWFSALTVWQDHRDEEWKCIPGWDAGHTQGTQGHDPGQQGWGQMGEDLNVTKESTVLTATELGLHAKQCIPLYYPLPPNYERHLASFKQ